MSIVLGIIGQVLLKRGTMTQGEMTLHAHKLWSTIWKIALNPFIISWILFAGLSAFLWIFVVSRFELTFAYPISLSLSYVLIALLSWWIFGEHLPPARLIGLLVMCVGIFLVYKS
jgi:multidrug transporter EmrE-like cation transporter